MHDTHNVLVSDHHLSVAEELTWHMDQVYDEATAQ